MKVSVQIHRSSFISFHSFVGKKNNAGLLDMQKQNVYINMIYFASCVLEGYPLNGP
jgi:hypothetical protein